MRVIKKINNNVAICIDEKGNELIAFGKGIGFSQIPYEITDLKIIHRTYYRIEPHYITLLEQLDEQLFDLVNEIIDYAYRNIDIIFDNNIAFTLADHIQFAIKRCKEGLQMRYSAYYDLLYLNPEAVKVGKFAVKLIQDKYGILLPYEERYGIAVHLLNAGAIPKPLARGQHTETLISEIITIVENYFSVQIDKEGFNYSRFASHMECLCKRNRDGMMLSTLNAGMFDSLREEYADTFACAEIVSRYFEEKEKSKLSEEEKLYLVLHINRLCSREDVSN